MHGIGHVRVQSLGLRQKGKLESRHLWTMTAILTTTGSKEGKTHARKTLNPKPQESVDLIDCLAPAALGLKRLYQRSQSTKCVAVRTPTTG